jgi:hypothetical protein
MTMNNDITLGLSFMYTADMYNSSQEELTPAVDARISPDWNAQGFIIAE